MHTREEMDISITPHDVNPYERLTVSSPESKIFCTKNELMKRLIGKCMS